MEDSINDLLGGFGLERHYSILVSRYLNRHPESSEYEMVKNEVEGYESFVEEVRTSIEKKEVIEGVNGKFSYDIDYLKSIEKYLEFFKDKLRILELEQKLEEKGIDSTWKFNTKEKVFLLYHLEILTFLRESGRVKKSPNSIAEVLAPLLNTSKSSLQKYINSYLSEDEIPEKPNEKSIEKIKKFLLERGFSK